MNEDIENPDEEYHRIKQALKDLRQLLEISPSQSTKNDIQKKIRKLELKEEELRSIFDLTDVEADEDLSIDTEEQDFPILDEAVKSFGQEITIRDCPDKDFKPFLIYLRYFETEFLGLFSARKLKLDVKYSIQRDNFYTKFSQIDRMVDDYLKELWHSELEDYSKAYEEELLRRRIEKKHQLLFEMNKLFEQLEDFSSALLFDIKGEEILCLNPDEVLEYSSFDHETILRNKNVTEALGLINDFSQEVQRYLDMPDL